MDETTTMVRVGEWLVQVLPEVVPEGDMRLHAVHWRDSQIPDVWARTWEELRRGIEAAICPRCHK